MGANSKIEWTDHTASPWYGCAHREFEDGSTHPGCQNCYAEAMSSRNPHTLGVWGTDGVRVKSKSFIANLRKWNREAQAAGKVVSVFPSLCDPFEDRPELEPWRQEMFAMLDECQFVRLLLLTKRPENVRRMWPRCEEDYEDGEGISHATYYRPHVWLGCSVSNQKTADRMVPELLTCRDLVPVLFLSAEPLLGPINLCRCGKHIALPEGHGALCPLGNHGIDWLIAGGESGPKARPMHPDWARSLRDQCQAAGAPFFFKQWGEWKPTASASYALGSGMEDGTNRVSMLADGRICLRDVGPAFPKQVVDTTALAAFDAESARWERLAKQGKHDPAWEVETPLGYQWMARVGKKAAGRLLDGREWSEFPAAAAMSHG